MQKQPYAMHGHVRSRNGPNRNGLCYPSAPAKSEANGFENGDEEEEKIDGDDDDPQDDRAQTEHLLVSQAPPIQSSTRNHTKYLWFRRPTQFDTHGQ